MNLTDNLIVLLQVIILNITTSLILRIQILHHTTDITILPMVIILIITLITYPILWSTNSIPFQIPSVVQTPITTTIISNLSIIIPILKPNLNPTKSLTTSNTIIVPSPTKIHTTIVNKFITILTKAQITRNFVTILNLPPIIYILNPNIILNCPRPASIPVLNFRSLPTANVPKCLPIWNTIIPIQNVSITVLILKCIFSIALQNPTNIMQNPIPILNLTTIPKGNPSIILMLNHIMIVQNLTIIISTPRKITIMVMTLVLFAILQLARRPLLLVLASQILPETRQVRHFNCKMFSYSKLKCLTWLIICCTLYNI